MRDLMKAGSRLRLRLLAASNGWRIDRRYVQEKIYPKVVYRHDRSGAVYIVADADQLDWPTAERVRVLAGAFFDRCCPCCEAEAHYAEGEPTEDLDRLQLVRMGGAVGGVSVVSGIALVIEHRAECPGRPGALAGDGAAASN